MKEWLSQYKYRGDVRYELLLSSMLEHAYDSLVQEVSVRGWFLKERLAHQHTWNKPSPRRSRVKQPIWKPDVITFVPVSGQRLLERGFNQARRLASYLGETRNVRVEDLLKRNYDSGKQSYKTRAQRLASMHELFSIKAKEFNQLLSTYRVTEVPGRALSIVLIDDIYTTGSTMNACSHAIQTFATAEGIQVEVYGLTWARS
ncbi:ComF family protein [Paenibacillus sp. JSM ZJ436]|uniref:ComF family protein n=1 Tax=Paenibacillus sp. JSM ZJ436 TaxID=3376190 RepID=UPI0037C8F67D